MYRIRKGQRETGLNGISMYGTRVVGTRCVDGRVPNCLLGGVGGGVGGK